MSNDLTVGIPRVGWLHHQKLPDPAQPAPCMLLDDGKQITLRVPLLSGTDDMHERWLLAPVANLAEDPDRTKHDYAAPETVAFIDRHGIVMLVGCKWSLAGWSNHGSEGVITAKRAVLGGNEYRYPMINAMRTEISGLADWLGLSGVDVNVDRDVNGRAQSITVTSQTTEPVRLSPRLNFSVGATWRTRNVTDGRGIEAPAEVTTQVAKVRSWDDHAELHHALLGLVEISAWSRIGFRTMEVRRSDDPENTLAGNVLAQKWNPVRSHERDHIEASAPGEPRRFLFTYADMGSRGVREWLQVRTTFQRGVQQMHALLHQPGMFIEVQQANVGGALEAIGYVLALEAGKSAHGAAREPYARRLERLRQKIPERVLDRDWPERSRAAFMAAKHVDAPAPPVDQQLRAIGENILAYRYWLARRLGSTDGQLLRLIRLDPVVRRYGLTITD